MAKLEDYFKNEETAGKLMKLIMPESGLKSMRLQPSGKASILYVNNIPVIYFDGDAITEMYLLGAKELHHDWLPFDIVKDIRFLELPNVESIGNEVYLGGLQRVSAPKLIRVGDWCDISKESQEFDAPSLQFVGHGFLRGAKKLKKLNVPKLKRAGEHFLQNNEALETLDLPNIVRVGPYFLYYNKKLSKLYAPKLTGRLMDCFSLNESLEVLDLPNVTAMASPSGGCFVDDLKLREVYLPKLIELDNENFFPRLIVQAYKRNKMAAGKVNFIQGTGVVQSASNIKKQEPPFIKSDDWNR